MRLSPLDVDGTARLFGAHIDVRESAIKALRLIESSQEDD